MDKKILSIITVIAVLGCTYSVAMADGATPANATKNSLKSHGSVVYKDGENNSVEIHSDDLYMLADQLDAYKTSTAEQLAAINTYFSTGENGINLISDSNIKVVHTQPSSGDEVDPLALNLDTLLEGIAASQSIPTGVTEYGYADTTALYKNSSGFLTTNSSNNGLEKINIHAATAENLSAGAAAWVNGTLIIGTGSDNQTYYNQGRTQGQNDVKNNTVNYGFTPVQEKELTYTVKLHTPNEGDRDRHITQIPIVGVTRIDVSGYQNSSAGFSGDANTRGYFKVNNAITPETEEQNVTKTWTQSQIGNATFAEYAGTIHDNDDVQWTITLHYGCHK